MVGLTSMLITHCTPVRVAITILQLLPVSNLRKCQFVHKMFVHNFCAPYPPVSTSKVMDFLLNFY